VTGESLGLLIEEQRTNLLLRSEEFDNASWFKNVSTVVADSTVAPNGTLTADQLVGDGTNDAHRIQQTATIVGAVSFSVYLKQGTERYAYLYILGRSSTNDTGNFTYIDLQDGVITSSGGTDAVTPTITTVGNGWFRLTTGRSTAFSGSTQIEVRIGVANTPNVQTSTASGYIFIWGAQLEAGAFATSYIPTTTAQVTRSADAASMTGANFSSWYRQDEGSIYAEVTTPVPSGASNAGFIWYADDNTGNNRIELRQVFSGDASPRVNVLFRYSNATVVNIIIQTTGNVWVINNYDSIKLGLGYQLDDVYFDSGNANAPVTDTSANIPLVNRVFFSHTGHYKKLSYYPQRLTNAQLQALTA
jgi:hypothetical protein